MSICAMINNFIPGASRKVTLSLDQYPTDSAFTDQSALNRKSVLPI